jgi:hypothetical protein
MTAHFRFAGCFIIALWAWAIALSQVGACQKASDPPKSGVGDAEKKVFAILKQIKNDISGSQLRDLDKNMKKYAPRLRALGKDAVPPLKRRLQPGKEDIWAILAAGWLGKDGEEVVPDLIRIAETQKENKEWVHYRMFAMGAAIEIRPKWAKHVPFLLDALDDPVLHHLAMDVLEGMGPVAKGAVPGLIKRVKRNYPESYPPYMRTTPRLVGLFGTIGPAASDAIPCLLGTLRSDDPGVRASSASALGQIGRQPKDVIPALRRSLTDKDLWVRRDAATALGSFGPLAKAALPDLRKALEDREWRVTIAAAAAIVNIESVQDAGRRHPSGKK